MIELVKNFLPRDTVINVVRTTAAGIGGLLVVWLVGLGVDVDSDTAVGFVQALAVGLFQLLVLVASRYVPWVSYLLIIPKTPSYVEVENVVIDSE